MNLHRYAGIVLSVLLLAAAGCDQPLPSPKQKEPTKKMESTKKPIQVSYQRALETYQRQGAAQLEHTRACVKNLRSSVDVFLNTPEAQGFAALYEMARHCHRLYQPAMALTASYPALDARLSSLRRRIDSRPITPGYVDYVEGYPQSGIVNDPALPLDADSLIAEQGLTDASDVVLGFEVVLFLLEGEHRYSPQLAMRRVEDYQAVDHWEEHAANEVLPATDHPNNRRRQYLQLTLAILEQDLVLLLNTWNTFALPETQEEAQALAFATVRNWHSVAASLASDDVGEVTDLLIDLISSPKAPDDSLAGVMGLRQLEGWPRDGMAVDPMLFGQALGQWLVQHNR